MTDTTESKILPEHKTDPHTLHIFMLVKSTRRWLDLPDAERTAFFRKELMPLFKKRPEVRLRYFDAEAFTALASDVLLWETDDLSAWQWIADQLRETLFWDHYFEVLHILSTLEANYFEPKAAS